MTQPQSRTRGDYPAYKIVLYSPFSQRALRNESH